ncbi:hypothetical protein [Frankia sp. Cas3]|uniref:GAP1-N2 domain-containing protein n=1 Tax=Frankia sp. Cas3 TaxID=3073926 RepID=UPI002AD2C855|nr:hypothetical protein [Frankia sp. Cas3]
MIHQLHYTSCETGRDGIQGFQISAATSGIPERLEDLAIQLSAYHVPPRFPLEPTVEEIRRCPVSFGYIASNAGTVVFRSVYVGTDFTGRQGNYFAHALVLDDPAELGGLLPIELWESRLWVQTSPASGTLPNVGGLTPSGFAEPEQLRNFLLIGRRLDIFGALLDAVTNALLPGGRRVIVVTPSSRDAARWIGAVVRSLPQGLARDISFSTFAAVPTGGEFLLVATTPDVTVIPSPYDPHVLIDLTGPGPIDDDPRTGASRYAAALTAVWRASATDVLAIVEHAGRATPPIASDELDVFIDGWHMLAGYPVNTNLADAVEFLLRRFPAAYQADVWTRAEAAALAGAPFGELARWSRLLRQTSQAGELPQQAIEAIYLRAVLNSVVAGQASDDLWLPDLTRASLETVVSNWLHGQLSSSANPSILALVRVVVFVVGSCSAAEQARIADAIGPVLARSGSPEAWDEIAAHLAHGELAARLVAALERHISSDDEALATVVRSMPAAAADFLARVAPRSSRVHIAVALVRAHIGGGDKVEAFRNALGATHGEPSASLVKLFTDILWPDSLPTPQEALDLLDILDIDTVAATKLPDSFYQLLVNDAESADGLTEHDCALATRLAQHDAFLLKDLGTGPQHTVLAIQYGAHFRTGPSPSKKSSTAAVAAVELYPRTVQAVGGWLLDAIADWLLHVGDAEYHLQNLTELEKKGGGKFCTAYSRRAAVAVDSGTPADLALIIPVWLAFSQKNEFGVKLMDQTLRRGIARWRKRDLDQVGIKMGALSRRLHRLDYALDPTWRNDWASWWAHWRASNLRSIFGRIRRRSGEK